MALGPNLLTNSTFDTNADGWSGSFGATGAVSGGVLTVTAVTQTPSGMSQDCTTIVGKKYRVRVEMKRGVAASEVKCRITDGAIPGAGYAEIASTATESLEYKTFDFVAIGTTSNVYLRISDGAAGATGLFDNVSVCEILPDDIFCHEGENA